MDPNNGHNILISTAKATARESLLKMALHEASLDHHIIYLTTTPFQYIPGGNATKALCQQRADITKNIIFMYPKTYAELTERLASLHNWSATPSLVIVECLDEFFGPRKVCELDLHHIALVLAMLHDLAAAFRIAVPTQTCFTVAALDGAHIKTESLQTLKQTYYYNENFFAGDDPDLYDRIMEYISNR